MQKRSRDSFWLVAALFLGGAMLVGIAFNLTKLTSPEDTPRYVTYSRHERGLKAMTRLLEAEGYQVKPLNATFRSLPEDADILIVFPGDVQSLFMNRNQWNEEDSDRLMTWVEEGGTLMVLEGDNRLDELNPLYDSGEPVGARLTKPGDWKAKPTLPLPFLKPVKQAAGKDAGWRLQPQGDRWVPLLHDSRGIIMARREMEEGIIIESIDADLFTNKHLREADNAQLLLMLVRHHKPPGSVVYIDEAGQGDLRASGDGSFWRGVSSGGKLAFFHLMVLTAVVMYSIGKRFGLPRPSRIRAPAMGEFITAMAQLYQNAQASHAALDIIVDDVRRSQCRRVGLPADSTLLQLIQALPPGASLRDALESAHRALQKPNLSEQEALSIARSLTEFKS